jgi:hypothetical protein
MTSTRAPPRDPQSPGPQGPGTEQISTEAGLRALLQPLLSGGAAAQLRMLGGAWAGRVVGSLGDELRFVPAVPGELSGMPTGTRGLCEVVWAGPAGEHSFQTWGRIESGEARIRSPRAVRVPRQRGFYRWPTDLHGHIELSHGREVAVGVVDLSPGGCGLHLSADAVDVPPLGARCALRLAATDGSPLRLPGEFVRRSLRRSGFELGLQLDELPLAETQALHALIRASKR